MTVTKFELPEELQNVTARSIEQNMMKNLPADIDKTEGGFAWDLTYPTALEKAEMIQFYMVRLLQIMFPMWADGKWLDLHARDCGGMTRRAANAAYGHVRVTGKAGLEIPAGFQFAVPADGGSPAVLFKTLADAEIPESGTVSIAVQAVEAGKSGNVGADTISIMVSPVSGITNITNPEPITGGAEEECDDSLRQRIDDYNAGRGKSYVGNNADYERWAEEVPGVGHAHTIPEYNGPNSVKIVVVDTDGLPANDQILQAVDLHIFGESRKDIARLAPVGVIDHLVAAPAAAGITYSFQLKLTSSATEDDVIKTYKEALSKYYAEIASVDDTVAPVQYVKAAAILTEIPGVADFKHFRINGALENVSFAEDEYPVTEDFEVTLYE